ncbi:MAG: TIGR01212 family radical SAM protein [Candidatus Omnitrophica bacterium]|nr:TIGR01212 family radical SAM protein [Candidatus Omnitrophota bacterium]
MSERYYSYSAYLKSRFGARVGRICVNAGFTCPNRDGSLDSSGCIYCNERAFSAPAGTGVDVSGQIRAALARAGRGNAAKYVLYFQNGSNTYAPVDRLRQVFDAIYDFPQCVSLSVSTRPDCVSDDTLDLLAGYARQYDVWLELGLQSAHAATLQLINRRHTAAQFFEAAAGAAARGIHVAAHLILGLPGESPAMMRQTAAAVAQSPVEAVKLHMLHVVRDTELARWYAEGRLPLLSRQEYVMSACDVLERLRQDCVILRLISDARADVLIAPEWINDKQTVIRLVTAELQRRGTRQGCLFPGVLPDKAPEGPADARSVD